MAAFMIERFCPLSIQVLHHQFRGGIKSWNPVQTVNSGSFQPEPERQIEIPVPVNKNRIYFSQIPVPVNKNRILKKKFRFKPELTGISHVSIQDDHY